MITMNVPTFQIGNKVSPTYIAEQTMTKHDTIIELRDEYALVQSGTYEDYSYWIKLESLRKH